MDPAPPSLFKCPHCDAHYVRENWLSGNTFGGTLWSDGVLTDGMTSADYDPIIQCKVCQNFFVSNNARIKNTRGFDRPKDKKFYGAGYTELGECTQLLQNEPLLLELGNASQFINHGSSSGLTDEQKKALALKRALFQVRFMIWRKLNDKIREHSDHGLSPEELGLHQQNSRALIPLVSINSWDDEQTLLLWKAELHRNLGEFGNSLKVLMTITNRSMLKTKRKMIFLNLMRNKKLVRLSGGDRNWRNKFRLWWTWI